MSRFRRSAAALAVACLAGCSGGGPDRSAATDPAAPAADTIDAGQSAAAVLAADQAVHAATVVDESHAVPVTLSGASASATAGQGVTVDGSTVTITRAGTYRLGGALTDGQIVVNAPDAAVALILDGVQITSSGTAAIAATEVGVLVVALAADSTNTLADASSYAEGADVNAALFSAGDLTLTGAGELTVTGAGNDGIASTDGLLI